MALHQQAFLRDFLKQIRRRPGLYLIPGESLHEEAKTDNETLLTLNSNFLDLFGLWCRKNYDVGDAAYWNAAEKLGGTDDRQRFHTFFQLLDEFEADVQAQGEESLVQELSAWKQAEEEKFRSSSKKPDRDEG